MDLHTEKLSSLILPCSANLINSAANCALSGSVPAGIAKTLVPNVVLFARPPSGTGTAHTSYGTSGAYSFKASENQFPVIVMPTFPVING